MSGAKDFARLRLNGSYGFYVDGKNNLDFYEAVDYVIDKLQCSVPDAWQYLLSLPKV